MLPYLGHFRSQSIANCCAPLCGSPRRHCRGGGCGRADPSVAPATPRRRLKRDGPARAFPSAEGRLAIGELVEVQLATFYICQECRFAAVVPIAAGSIGGRRLGSNGCRSTVCATPSTISSAIASPVAGALRIPQTLCPVAT